MGEPTLSLCMIVKNEEVDLPRCLRSVQGIVDEIIVVDTGSRDRTVEVAEQFGARVLRRPWRGSFAEVRNHALEAAAGDWVLTLDADEELEAGSGQRLRSLLQREEVEAYSLIVVNVTRDPVWTQSENATSVRLWRHCPEYRFERDLHEQIVPSIQRARPDARLAAADVRIIHHGYNKLEVERKGKRFRNLPMARQAVKSLGDDFSHFNLGIELMIQNRHHQALDELRQAERLMQPNSDLKPKLAKAITSCLLQLRQAEDALREIDRYIQEMPDFTDLLFLRGFIYFQMGQWTEAGAYFRRCLELGPAPAFKYPGATDGCGSYQAAWMLGQVHEAQQDSDGALTAYRKAYELNRDWPTPLFRYASLLGRHLDPDRLAAELEQIIDRQRSDWPLLIAQSLYVAKAFTHVITYLNRPELRVCSPSACHFLRGQAQLRLGQWPEAVQSLSQVTTDSPNYPEATTSLYWLYSSLNRPEEARRLRRRLDTSEAFYLELGDISLQCALEWCLRAIALGGDPSRLGPIARVLQMELRQHGAT